jgi:hypothetical protein
MSACPCSRTSCDDGCLSCTCVQGDWRCTSSGSCRDQPECPAQIPIALGEDPTPTCTHDGQLCTGWGDCSPVCECSQGVWLCHWPTCVCPEEKPTAPPGEITYCETPNAICDYGNNECARCIQIRGREGPETYWTLSNCTAFPW